ncbi:MFS transporter [archaeon]|nr:MAG: MFS transporter [archaeon]
MLIINENAAIDQTRLSLTHLPKRWEMALLLFTGVLVVYTLRVNISVAAEDMKDDLNWSEAEKGLVLSSFYWGYALGQVPASRLVQIYGAKWIFGFSILVPSVLTIFVPMACRGSFGLGLFIRALIGFCESASFPAVFHFFPQWVPIKEKTFMIPAIISGMYMGEIVGFSLSGLLLSSNIYMNGYNYGQWQSVFYIFGFMGIVWFPFWAYFAHENPAHHPTISPEEVALINDGKIISSLNEYEASVKKLNDPSVQQVVTHSDKMEKSERSAKTVTVEASPVDSIATGAENVLVDTETGLSQSISLKFEEENYEPNSMPGSEHHINPMAISHNAVEYDNNQPRKSHLFLVNPVRPSSVKSMDQVEVSDRTREISVVALDSEHHRMELAQRTPWKIFFTHPVSLTLLINNWAYGWINFTLLSEMPSFMSEELGFNISSAGVLCVFPYLALFLATIFFGKMFNYMQDNHGMSTDTVRQLAETISLVGASIGLIICGFLPNSYAAYAMLIVTQVSIHHIILSVVVTIYLPYNLCYLNSSLWVRCKSVWVAPTVMWLPTTHLL